MSIANLISLLSGIALFLFGMALMGDGLKKVAGNKLEVILFRLTGSPLKGFLLGTGVTAVIQSSSATSVMVVGFVNSGMMRVAPGHLHRHGRHPRHVHHRLDHLPFRPWRRRRLDRPVLHGHAEPALFRSLASCSACSLKVRRSATSATF